MTHPFREESPEKTEGVYPPGYKASGNGEWWGAFSPSRWFSVISGKLNINSTTNKAQTVEYAWRAAWLELSHIIEKLNENHGSATKHERSLRFLRREEVKLQARLKELAGPLAIHGFGPLPSEPEGREGV